MRHRSPFILACLSVFLPLLTPLILPAAPARAAVLRVRADTPGPAHDGTTWATAYTAIQPALDAAKPGDEVWVAIHYNPYHERVRINKAGIGLYGGFRGVETNREQRKFDYPSPLNGDDLAGPVVEVESGGGGAVIDGFRIYRERASSHQGIKVVSQGVTISHNTISGHGAAISNMTVGMATGGGIVVHSSNATITDNVVTGNHSARGAGVYVAGRNILVARNVITDNVAGGPNETFAEGGGLSIFSGPVVVRDNVIARNVVMAYSTNPDSTTGAWGGGIALSYANAIIANNTIVHNVVSGTSATRGGGIFTRSSAFTLSNNIVAFNRAESLWGRGTASGGGIGYEDNPGYESQVTARHNLFFGNTPDDGLPADDESTVRADPLLENRQDYRLTAASPAIDAGLNAAAAPGGPDVAGQARVVGATVDIGAYEYPVSRTPGTLERVYVRPDGDDTRSGATWAEARRSVGSAMSVLKPDGEVWIAAGTYTDRLRLVDGTSLYGGFAGTETDRDARDIPSIRAHPTILDGLSRGTVLTIQGSGVTVDGLTIRRGSGSGSPGYRYGGGIFSTGSKVTLSRCIIEDNEALASEDNPAGTGGGMFQQGGSITLANNIIRRNTLSVAQQMSFPQYGNAAFGSGGGVTLAGCVATVVNNLFTDNLLAMGGALSQYFADGAALSLNEVHGLVANNTFSDNRDEIMYGTSAGALSISGAVTVANNIIAFNTSGVVGTTPNFRRNDVVSNGDFDDGAPADALGNIHLNPRFSDRAAANYRPLPGSPVIDAGLDTAAPAWPDLDNNPRIQGAHVDMGAYEFASTGTVILADVRTALSVAAGFQALDPAWLPRLNIVDPDGSGVDLRDAVALARKVAGLAPNP